MAAGIPNNWMDARRITHRQWVAQALAGDERWSETIAVGIQAYVEEVKRSFEITARHREVDEANWMYALREAWVLTQMLLIPKTAR